MNASDSKESALRPPRRLVAVPAEDGSGGLAAVGLPERLEVDGPQTAWAIWASDDPPRLGLAEQPWERTLFPPSGGVRVYFGDMPPADDSSGEHAPHRMHSSDSLDFVFVISGLIDLVLEDGTTERLTPGDGLVQSGNLHSWHNPGPEVARVAFVMLGLERE